MKVVLLKDVPALGKKNEMKEVSGGYARNFLLPQKLAVPATDAALASIAGQKAREERAQSKQYAAHRALAEKLKTTTLIFKIKLGEKGKAFGSVTAVKIRDALNKQGIAVDKDWILLEGPIKTTGEKIVGITFPHGIKSEIKIIIEPEIKA